MRFSIPPEHKSSVSVFRPSAFHRGDVAPVATEVICLLSPQRKIDHVRGAVQTAAGVAIEDTDWAALLEVPNTAILKGDIVRNSEGVEFRVEDVSGMRGSSVMILNLKAVGVL